MKRLLIATFLLVVSVTIYALSGKTKKAAECPKSQQTCCLKKQKPAPSQDKPDHIFWEPVSRLMMIR